jgi:hypothetical protein
MRRLRDDPLCADEEYAAQGTEDDRGLSVSLTFDPDRDIVAPFIARGARPAVAVLREQGVNSHVETAAILEHARFIPHDVHMTDLIGGGRSRRDFRGLCVWWFFPWRCARGGGGAGPVDPVSAPASVCTPGVAGFTDITLAVYTHHFDTGLIAVLSPVGGVPDCLHRLGCLGLLGVALARLAELDFEFLTVAHVCALTGNGQHALSSIQGLESGMPWVLQKNGGKPVHHWRRRLRIAAARPASATRCRRSYAGLRRRVGRQKPAAPARATCRSIDREKSFAARLHAPGAKRVPLMPAVDPPKVSEQGDAMTSDRDLRRQVPYQEQGTEP